MLLKIYMTFFFSITNNNNKKSCPVKVIIKIENKNSYN